MPSRATSLWHHGPEIDLQFSTTWTKTFSHLTFMIVSILKISIRCWLVYWLFSVFIIAAPKPKVTKKVAKKAAAPKKAAKKAKKAAPKKSAKKGGKKKWCVWSLIIYKITFEPNDLNFSSCSSFPIYLHLKHFYLLELIFIQNCLFIAKCLSKLSISIKILLKINQLSNIFN